MKTATLIVWLMTALPATASIIVPGADGSDGAFNPGGSVEIDLALATAIRRAGRPSTSTVLARRRDTKAGRRLSEWLDTVTHDFDDRIIPVTTEVCERWALLNVPDPVPVIDGLLAATALEWDLVLVTRNTADVERTGVAVVNPFAGPDTVA